MNVKGKCRYLSHCVFAFMVAQAAVLILTAAGFFFISRPGAWPILVTVALALEAGLWIAFYFWALRPYRAPSG
jgi:uncharacterized membrane protein